MSYTPNNMLIYLAAFSGALSGMGAFTRGQTETSSLAYANLTQQAALFAQEVDTLYLPSAVNELNTQVVSALAEGLYSGRNQSGAAPSDYQGMARVLMAMVTSSETFAAANLPPIPSAGSGGDIGTRVIYVAKNGSDTNSGSFSSPFLTIQRAMNLVAARGDGGTTIRYLISVAPGNYDDAVVWEPWTFVAGMNHSRSFRMNPSALSLSLRWTPNVDQQAGLCNCTYRAASTWDFGAVSTNQGKLFFENCIFSALQTFTAYSSINQVTLHHCYLQAGYTQNGINMSLYATALQNGGTVTMNSIASSSTLASWIASGSDGPVTINLTGGHPTTGIEFVNGGISGLLTLNGAGILVASKSPPWFPGGVALSGGATDPRANVTGSRGANAALASLLTSLQTLGGIIDSTT